MRTITLDGKFTNVINRNPFEAVYLFRDRECGEVILNVKRKLPGLYEWVDMSKDFKLLVRIEGSSYRTSLADPVRHVNKMYVIKVLKLEGDK